MKANRPEKLAALAKLPKMPTRNKSHRVPCASGGVAQVDLGAFWNKIRWHLCPELGKKLGKERSTKLEKAEEIVLLRRLLAVPWVQEALESMKAEAANEPADSQDTETG